MEGEAELAWFNGDFLPVGDVKISPFDRGFLFADGVYEGMRHYPRTRGGGGIFRLDQHLRRLGKSLDTLRIFGVELDRLVIVLPELVRRNGLESSDATVYLQITRGIAPRTHAFPDPPVMPTCLALVRSFRPLDAERERGFRCQLVEDLRWGRCDIKSVSLLPNVLAQDEAVRRGADEAIFVRDGRITEGSHTAVMVVREGCLIAPPEGPEILPSVTREVVLELADKLGIGVRLEAIDVAGLATIDEMLVLGTSTEVMPVVELDGQSVGTGRPGPVARRLQAVWPAGRG